MNIQIKTPSKSEIFSQIFQHIKVFTDNIIIVFNTDRVYFQSMDSSHILIFELHLPSPWFDKYEFNHNGNIPLGVNASLLFKILNTREKGQETEIIYSTEDEDKLFLNFTSEDKTMFDKRFELPLMDLDNEFMSIPEMECNAEFSLASASFANIVNQLKLFGDTIDIICSEEKIVLRSLSEGSGKMSVEIQIDELTEYSIDEGEVVHLSFSLNMLHNICLYNKVAKEVRIKLIKDSPMQVLYNLGNSAEDTDNRLVFYLAPKINDE
jgi:proliferating cell nuclear antigen PCNA